MNRWFTTLIFNIDFSDFQKKIEGGGCIPLKLNYDLLATVNRWFTTFIFNTDISDFQFFFEGGGLSPLS